MNKLFGIVYGITKSLGIALFALVALGLVATLVSKAANSNPLHKSIVKVLNDEGTGGGTGWAASTPNGDVIVTNDHVCEVSSNGYVRIDLDGGQSMIKKILRRSYMRDLCVIEGVGIPTLPIANKLPKRFDEIHVIGHPYLKPAAPTRGVFTGTILIPFLSPRDDNNKCRPGSTEVTLSTFFGEVPACKKTDELNTSTVHIAPGNSGSPVLNSSGEVVGVMNSAMADMDGLFIPLPYLKQILAE